MFKKIFNIILILITLAGASYAIWSGYNLIVDRYNQTKGDLQEITQSEINKPGPLLATGGSDQAHLTKQGIIKWTNKQRAEHGLSALFENTALGKSALVKAQDMFNKQYFAHESPTGKNVNDLAEVQGYQFIVIGENLALGNFKDDQTVVQAWMDSPGHRANILNKRYDEIGVGVIQGIYKGQQTWMAVQHFGTPSSTCSHPSASLKSQIEKNNQQLVSLEQEIEDSKALIKSTSGDERNQAVAEYNQTIKEYNALVEENKSLTTEYNNQISKYNNCVKG